MMAPRRGSVATYYSLTARISSHDFSYEANQSDTNKFTDRMSLDLEATIETIDPKLERHLGKAIRISLGASGYQSSDAEGDERPILFPINLRGEKRDISGDIPSNVLLALPGMIESGGISFVWAWFEPPKFGSGKLRSITFISEAEAKKY